MVLDRNPHIKELADFLPTEYHNLNVVYSGTNMKFPMNLGMHAHVNQTGIIGAYGRLWSTKQSGVRVSIKIDGGLVEKYGANFPSFTAVFSFPDFPEVGKGGIVRISRMVEVEAILLEGNNNNNQEFRSYVLSLKITTRESDVINLAFQSSPSRTVNPWLKYIFSPKDTFFWNRPVRFVYSPADPDMIMVSECPFDDYKDHQSHRFKLGKKTKKSGCGLIFLRPNKKSDLKMVMTMFSSDEQHELELLDIQAPDYSSEYSLIPKVMVCMNEIVPMLIDPFHSPDDSDNDRRMCNPIHEPFSFRYSVLTVDTSTGHSNGSTPLTFLLPGNSKIISIKKLLETAHCHLLRRTCICEDSQLEIPVLSDGYNFTVVFGYITKIFTLEGIQLASSRLLMVPPLRSIDMVNFFSSGTFYVDENNILLYKDYEAKYTLFIYESNKPIKHELRPNDNSIPQNGQPGEPNSYEYMVHENEKGLMIKAESRIDKQMGPFTLITPDRVQCNFCSGLLSMRVHEENGVFVAKLAMGDGGWTIFDLGVTNTAREFNSPNRKPKLYSGLRYFFLTSDDEEGVNADIMPLDWCSVKVKDTAQGILDL